jgi:hypothetical protein
MQALNPRAIQRFTSVLDYEAHILVQSMYHETRKGTIPINPARFIGRYTLKYVAIHSVFLKMQGSKKCDLVCSNMLTLAFATRTNSTCDPLIERALAMNEEFMHLTGRLTPFLLYNSGALTEVTSQVLCPMLSTSSNHSNGSLLPCDPGVVGSMTQSWKSTVT